MNDDSAPRHEQRTILRSLNIAPTGEAISVLLGFCGSAAWSIDMASTRPFESVASVHAAADDAFDRLDSTDWVEAFNAHPRVGDLGSLRMKFAGNHRWSADEQAGATGADEQTLRELAAGNDRYHSRFGFTFVVCATGKSAAEMLDGLSRRLSHQRDREIAVASAQQRKITHLRIDKHLLTHPQDSP